MPPDLPIGDAPRSAGVAQPPLSQKKPTHDPDRLYIGCALGCIISVLLPAVACIVASLLGPWVYDQLNPSFVPPAHAQQCGSIEVYDGQDHTPAESCFWQTYQMCHTAVLDVSYSGTDFGVAHHFVIEKQAADCSLSDYVQSSDANQRVLDWLGLKDETKFDGLYQCSGLQQIGSGLRFKACGAEGDLDLDADQNRTLPILPGPLTASQAIG